MNREIVNHPPGGILFSALTIRSNHAGIGGGEYVNATGSKTTNKIGVHRVFVNVESNATHVDLAEVRKSSSATASSVAMSLSISSRLAW